MQLTQTGRAGTPSEPFVVSFGLVGQHGPEGPDLRPMATDLLEDLVAIRQRARAEGLIDHDQWHLTTMSVDGRQDSSASEGERPDERRFAEAVAGVPERLDSVRLSSGGYWGTLRLAAGRPFPEARPVRSLTAQAEVSDASAGDAAEALLVRLREAAERTTGVQTGYVAVDTWADPYTDVVAHPARLWTDGFQARVHGYYWAVLLTEGQLAALGGLPRVRDRVPVERVESVETPDGPALLAVVTRDPRQLDEPRLRTWRAFLEPVLRPGFPSSWEDLQLDLGVTPLRRPLWLFEGPPVPEDIQGVLVQGMPVDAPRLPVSPGNDLSGRVRGRCVLRPGPGYDAAAGHLELIAAVVRAWATAGASERLASAPARWIGEGAWSWYDDAGHPQVAGVRGRFAQVGDVVRRPDANGAEMVVFTFDLGDAVPTEVALERLVSALSLLTAVVEGHGGPILSGIDLE